jgi:thiamine biosynthesis lipoprotein
MLSRLAEFHTAIEDARLRDRSPQAPGEPASTDWSLVTVELDELISVAFEISEATDRAFEPHLAPLVSLWGFHGESPAVPRTRDIEDVLHQIGSRGEPPEEFRTFDTLDLRGIAYGAAADAGAEFLAEALASAGSRFSDSWMTDVGGHIRVGSGKPSGEPFLIGIRSPLHESKTHLAVLELQNAAVSTVGPHQGYFFEEGIRYHHILDPKTGFPVANGLISVTVVAKTATTADAMATGCFVLGLQAGLALVESLNAMEAVFVDQHRRIHATAGIRKSLKQIHDDYRLVE